MAIVEFRDYTWKYSRTKEPALKNINLKVEEGTFVGIIGPNGAGKTTLAYSINGLIPNQYYGVRQGAVYVLDKEVKQYRSDELTKLVGMVFSDPEAQFTAMTVEDELVFGMENLGMGVPEIRERLDWVVPLTKIGPLLEKPPYEVSGGQKARVALAAVLAMTPRIMVLDEPTSMLDPISRITLFEVLGELKHKQSNTIIVVEHSLEHLIPLADRMVLLYNGEIVLDDETEPFFEQMETILEHDAYPPEALRFFYEIGQKGYYQGPLPFTVEEAAQKLEALWQGGE